MRVKPGDDLPDGDHLGVALDHALDVLVDEVPQRFVIVLPYVHPVGYVRLCEAQERTRVDWFAGLDGPGHPRVNLVVFELVFFRFGVFPWHWNGDEVERLSQQRSIILAGGEQIGDASEARSRGRSVRRLSASQENVRVEECDFFTERYGFAEGLISDDGRLGGVGGLEGFDELLADGVEFLVDLFGVGVIEQPPVLSLPIDSHHLRAGEFDV